jgi:aminomethyltransferase
VKPGKYLLGDGSASRDVTALEDDDPFARAGEVRRSRQAVMPAADHDRVVSQHSGATIVRPMPIGTAVHARTSALCQSLNFREWSGYFAVSSYETHHEYEYAAIRSGVALIDVSPLFKYVITGPDAVRLVDRIITRDASALQVGQVCYTPWCDERGKVLDDGTVARIGEIAFRLTSAEPNLRWLVENAAGLNVAVQDASERIAAFALQGPLSTACLEALDIPEIALLKYYRMTHGSIAGTPVEISRTGYTGDLGYELWVPASHAIDVWDHLMGVGAAFALRPTGLLALDIARIEAGFLLVDVDYHSSRKADIPSHAYSPFELGLERLVKLDKTYFVGRDALVAESRRTPSRRVVGLEIGWPAIERLYEEIGLPPKVPSEASRAPAPVYARGRQIGRATSTTWSPTLKKLIALATIDSPYHVPGTAVDFEVTVDATRHAVPATVVKTPFYAPARKTAVGGQSGV